MTVPELLRMLVVAIVNALTFDLLVNGITFILNLPGPWTSIVMGTLLGLTSCVVYAFPNLVGEITKDRLLTAGVTLLRYLLPWIGLRLLWKPSNWLLCSFQATMMFSGRCHHIKFNGSGHLFVGGFGSFTVIGSSDGTKLTTDSTGLTTDMCTGLTTDYAFKLLHYWRQTPIYRFFSSCRPNADAGISTDRQVSLQTSQPQSPDM